MDQDCDEMDFLQRTGNFYEIYPIQNFYEEEERAVGKVKRIEGNSHMDEAITHIPKKMCSKSYDLDVKYIRFRFSVVDSKALCC